MESMAPNELELKLGVWSGFVLPDLGSEATAGEEQRLEAVYHDTGELRLLRHGVTVSESAGAWSGRLPDRRVLGSAEELLLVTLGWALGEPLEPVARLVTQRRTITVGAATIHDDDVGVLRGEKVAARFRELCLHAESAKQLEKLAGKLRDAGAQPVDPVPKLVRALGPAAVAPVEEPGDETAADAISSRLSRLLRRWTERHAELVLDGAPAAVRAVRSGARGLRRELRVLTTASEIRDELEWLVDATTPVYRLDQVLGRVGTAENSPAPSSLGAFQAGAAGLRAQLVSDRAVALEAALAALREERYAALLREVAVVVARPPLAGKAGRAPADVLPRLVREPLRRVRRAAPDDVEKLRRQVDRLYVAARAAAPYAGPTAKRAVSELADLRVLLREHARAQATVDTLRSAAERTGANAWEAGLLAGAERALAAEARAGIADALERATRRKLWDWVP